MAGLSRARASVQLPSSASFTPRSAAEGCDHAVAAASRAAATKGRCRGKLQCYRRAADFRYNARMPSHGTVFLFDVDNTLLFNDRVTADLRKHLESQIGPEQARRYWDEFERLRSELGYADYLGALQSYRLKYPRDPNLLAASYFLMRYPFANRLFPGSLDAVEHVKQFGPV